MIRIETMELPIASESYQPSPQVFIRAVKRVTTILARTVAQETTLDTATIYTHPNRQDVRSANFAADLHLSEGIEAEVAVAEVLDHFQRAGTCCHMFFSADERWEHSLSQCLENRGYRAATKHVYLLKCHTRIQTPAGLQIIPARAAYDDLRIFYGHMARDELRADERLATHLAETMIDHLDEPRLELFLGRLEGQTVSVAGITTLGQIGVISPAYTHPKHRGNRISSAMLSHTLDYCARAQMEQIILERKEGCYSTPFYEKMGFKQVASYVKYVRHKTG